MHREYINTDTRLDSKIGIPSYSIAYPLKKVRYISTLNYNMENIPDSQLMDLIPSPELRKHGYFTQPDYNFIALAGPTKHFSTVSIKHATNILRTPLGST